MFVKMIMISFLALLLNSGYAQSSVRPLFRLPVVSLRINLLQPEKTNTFLPIKISSPSEKESALVSFLSDPVLTKLPEFAKKAGVISAEFSYGDFFENGFNSVNAALINKYDDHIAELFKDAPSLIRIKCIIQL